MSFHKINVKSVSFGPDMGMGTEYPLAHATVECEMLEDTAESGVATFATGATTSEVDIDQLVSEFEATVLKVSLSSFLGGEALAASKATHVAVQVLDLADRVIVFPHCLHGGEIQPPKVTLTAQDISDGSGNTFWYTINGNKIYGDKKIKF